jgi:hypothetical protein
MKTTITRALTPVVVYAVLSMGCGTSYSSREPGRIHYVLSSTGEETIEKDGRIYKLSPFSGDLAKAVSGNKVAEEHARKYVHRQRVAGGLAIVAGIALIVAYIGVAESITGVPENRPRAAIIGYSSALGAMAAVVGAGIVGETGMGDLYDAINVYNDDVRRR